MNLVELDRALRQLRLSGMAAVLETRLRQAQSEKLPPLDLVSALVADELQRRQDRLLDRRHKLARFRDPDRSLDTFDFDFNKKMNRALVYELATARFITQREDVLFLGPPGTGKSHLAQAIGRAAIQQGYRVIYREAHTLLEELAEATLAGTRKAYLTELATVPLLIIDDLGMRKLAHTAAEDLLELIMRRYERASTLLTSNRPVDDWGKLLGDTAAVTALLDRLLHHAHVLKCGAPKSTPTCVPRTGKSKTHLSRLPEEIADSACRLIAAFELSTEALDNGEHLDLAMVDIFRDRERGVPRYNQFRRLMHKPPVTSFDELTENPAWRKQIRDVYNGDLEKVDLMTGLFEEPLPEGFGFSDTAFRVFILMASRRLKSDRFFTDDFRPEIYTEFGVDYIRKNTMLHVLRRHYPQLPRPLEGIEDAFHPWKKITGPAAPAM